MKKMKLICFPYAGGSSNIYNKINEFLSEKVEFVAMELPGRGTRFAEKSVTTIDEMVNDALLWFNKIQPQNYAIFGYSMGSIIAYEFYYKLLQNGFKPPQHMFIAASEPTGVKRESRGVAKMSDSEFINFIRSMNGTPKEVFANQELLDIVVPIIRADFLAIDEYNYKPRNLQISCDVTVLAGEDDTISKKNILLWDKYVQNGCEYQFFKGDHFFIKDSYKEIAELINTTLVDR
ncbi:thioesterase [Bacillus cereus]|uniref:Thioesterase n=1 Tax=Bacillus cereus TaxID=1396 RepID=A0A9X6Z9E4_BACCE|nr:thioesterase domain-containing protein [Bacillus cereus]PFB31339.1 thioesterase [Bacillus cereus]PFC11799.1 thioesterase [Bacillus cereus]PFD22341.1 thioesterase [Bacillus cereus]PFL61421.1 thioesterase [Bacillus cereus]PGW63533.1 thioesterase [Bacillus cereus]